MTTKKFEQEEVFMNTLIRIQVFSDQGTVATKTKLQHAFSCFDQVVKKYTRFNHTSELAKLNNSAGRAYPVSKEFLEIIEYMLELVKISDGVYDPTVIDLLETYGYDNKQDFHQLDDPKLYDQIRQLVKIRPSPFAIKLDKKNQTVTLAPKQRLDLGSIGKGFAIDLAYSVLKDMTAVMINAGGDIRVKGPKPDGAPWQIGLDYSQLPNQKIHKQTLLGTTELNQGSICGSGGWARKVKFFHHLLNPKTGVPINEVSQSYVIAPTAREADSWATVLFTLGVPGLKLVEKQGYSGLIVAKNGKIQTTTGFQYNQL